MNIEERHRIYYEALGLWGIINQSFMMIEECGELIDAMAKSHRGRVGREEIITELADVSIMVEQMALFHGWEDFLKEREAKLLRLNERLEKYKSEMYDRTGKC